jgi:HSP20 family protein
LPHADGLAGRRSQPCFHQEKPHVDPSVVPRPNVRRTLVAPPSLFDELLRAPGAVPTAAAGAFVPRVDVIETAGALQFVAELPGVAEKEFQVIVDADVLTIKGEKQLAAPEGEADIRRRERSGGAFSRAFRVPFDVDPDSVTGVLSNGVLCVTVPKPAQEKPRTVPITTAEG